MVVQQLRRLAMTSFLLHAYAQKRPCVFLRIPRFSAIPRLLLRKILCRVCSLPCSSLTARRLCIGKRLCSKHVCKGLLSSQPDANSSLYSYVVKCSIPRSLSPSVCLSCLQLFQYGPRTSALGTAALGCLTRADVTSSVGRRSL